MYATDIDRIWKGCFIAGPRPLSPSHDTAKVFAEDNGGKFDLKNSNNYILFSIFYNFQWMTESTDNSSATSISYILPI